MNNYSSQHITYNQCDLLFLLNYSCFVGAAKTGIFNKNTRFNYYGAGSSRKRKKRSKKMYSERARLLIRIQIAKKEIEGWNNVRF